MFLNFFYYFKVLENWFNSWGRIGREVIPAGKAVLENLPAKHDLQFEFVNLDAGFELFKKTGTALPDETVDVLKRNVMVHCLGLFHRQPLKLLDTLPQLLH